MVDQKGEAPHSRSSYSVLWSGDGSVDLRDLRPTGHSHSIVGPATQVTIECCAAGSSGELADPAAWLPAAESPLRCAATISPPLAKRRGLLRLGPEIPRERAKATAGQACEAPPALACGQAQMGPHTRGTNPHGCTRATRARQVCAGVVSSRSGSAIIRSRL